MELKLTKKYIFCIYVIVSYPVTGLFVEKYPQTTESPLQDSQSKLIQYLRYRYSKEYVKEPFNFGPPHETYDQPNEGDNQLQTLDDAQEDEVFILPRDPTYNRDDQQFLASEVAQQDKVNSEYGYQSRNVGGNVNDSDRFVESRQIAIPDMYPYIAKRGSLAYRKLVEMLVRLYSHAAEGNFKALVKHPIIKNVVEFFIRILVSFITGGGYLDRSDVSTILLNLSGVPSLPGQYNLLSVMASGVSLLKFYEFMGNVFEEE